jgi:hypothetical protein
MELLENHPLDVTEPELWHKQCHSNQCGIRIANARPIHIEVRLPTQLQNSHHIESPAPQFLGLVGHQVLHR